MFGLQHRARALRAGVCKPWREYFSRSLSFWVGRPRPAHESLLALPVCAGMGGGLWSNGDTAKSSHEWGSTGRGGRMKEGKSKKVKGGNAAVSQTPAGFAAFFVSHWDCFSGHCENGVCAWSAHVKRGLYGSSSVWILVPVLWVRDKFDCLEVTPP